VTQRPDGLVHNRQRELGSQYLLHLGDLDVAVLTPQNAKLRAIRGITGGRISKSIMHVCLLDRCGTRIACNIDKQQRSLIERQATTPTRVEPTVGSHLDRRILLHLAALKLVGRHASALPLLARH
jgi:hypothetical protein